jgi:hypothetical protein
MSAEYLTAFGTIGTFVVIAITAIAAVVQLRHIRSANQLTGALHVTERFRSDEIQSATRFIYDELPARLREPAYRAELMFPGSTDRRSHPELFVCDMFEHAGSYIKHGMLEPAQFLDFAGTYVLQMWQQLREVVALRRAGTNDAALYENFEYVAVLAEDYSGAHHGGTYPHGARRLMPAEEWRALQVPER